MKKIKIKKIKWLKLVKLSSNKKMVFVFDTADSFMSELSTFFCACTLDKRPRLEGKQRRPIWIHYTLFFMPHWEALLNLKVRQLARKQQPFVTNDTFAKCFFLALSFSPSQCGVMFWVSRDRCMSSAWVCYENIPSILQRTGTHMTKGGEDLFLITRTFNRFVKTKDGGDEIKARLRNWNNHKVV